MEVSFQEKTGKYCGSYGGASSVTIHVNKSSKLDSARRFSLREQAQRNIRGDV